MTNNSFGEKDNKGREAILRRIKELSASYVPEWRLREDMKEPGSVLSFLFADMQWKTSMEYERLPEKMKREFYNMTGASIKAAEPAKGYVCFEAAGETEGICVPAGTALSTSRLMTNDMPVPAVTAEDVFVSDIRPEAVYFSDKKRDGFYLMYDREREGEISGLGFCEEASANLQEHELCLYHSFILDGGEECKVTISSKYKEDMEKLYSSRFFYNSGEGFEEFIKEISEEEVILRKNKNAPRAVKEEGFAGAYKIKIIPQAFEEEAFIKDIELGGFCGELSPDYMSAGGAECVGEAFEPFGKRFTRYDEFSLFSGDVLSKKEAEIKLSFELFFEEEDNTSESDIKWKLIMKKDDMRSAKEYDITIRKVIWEYFNGTGWAALFKDGKYSDIFNGRKTGRRTEMCFTCPKDIEEAASGGFEGYSIRARIIEVNNEFKANSRFIYPVIKNLRVSYKYENKLSPQAADCINNGEYEKNAVGKRGYLYFKPLPCEHKCLYFGFSGPFLRGAENVLFVMKETKKESCPRLGFCYLTEKGRRKAEVRDETESLRRTGTVVLPRAEGLRKTRLFGRELFWLLIEDIEDSYANFAGGELPVISAVYMNAVRAETLRKGVFEYFTAGEYGKAESFSLMCGDVREAEVWVLEKGELSKEEYERLKASERIRIDDEARGNWIKWEEKDSLSGAGSGDRVYMLLRREGRIAFGDGIEGRLLPADTENGIYVKYDTGGGSECNLMEGEITGLEYTRPEIAGAFNPLPFYGGSDSESIGKAMERKAYELRSLKRPVSARDFEAAATSLGDYVKRARCFKGRNEKGIREPGTVTVVVLLKKGAESPDALEAFKAKYFEYIGEGTELNLKESGRLKLAAPDFLKMEIRADVLIADIHSAYADEKRIIRRLKEFLERPRDIGELPRKDEILMEIQSEENVIEVRNLTVSLKRIGGRRNAEMNLKAASELPYAVALPGDIGLNIKTEW